MPLKLPPLPPTVNDHLPAIVARAACGCVVASASLRGWTLAAKGDFHRRAEEMRARGLLVTETTVGAIRQRGGEDLCDHAASGAQGGLW